MVMTKLMNDYAKEVPNYDDIPKSVLAALAFSPAMRLEEDDPERAKQLLITEWAILHQGGLVPQSVPSKLYGMVDTDVFQPEVNEYPGWGN
jgi:hypothetical protein